MTPRPGRGGRIEPFNGPEQARIGLADRKVYEGRPVEGTGFGVRPCAGRRPRRNGTRCYTPVAMTTMIRFLIDAARPARLGLGLVAFGWSLAAAASPLDVDGTAVAWSRLMFRPVERADDLAVEVSLTEADGARLSALLGDNPGRDRGADPGDDPEEPAGATVWQMTATIDVRYTGQVYRSEVWFSSGADSPWLRYRDKLGRDANRKAYRYLEDGVRRRRIEPEGSTEADQPPERWSRIKEHFFPYGLPRAGCPVLFDPSMLFLVASAGAVSPTDGPLTLCVFNKKTLYRVRLTAGPADSLPVAYVERKDGIRREVSRDAAVRTVRIEAEAAATGEIEPEPFEFFEMSGEIAIDLDPESGLPLRISGQIGRFGQVVVLLAEADLRP